MKGPSVSKSRRSIPVSFLGDLGIIALSLMVFRNEIYPCVNLSVAAKCLFAQHGIFSWHVRQLRKPFHSNLMKYPVTPDGRYFVVRGRLWRCSDPRLPADRRAQLTHQLMAARRDRRRSLQVGDIDVRERARQRLDEAKHALGERGAVWWTDGAPDWNRHLARNTPYADWFATYPREAPLVAPSARTDQVKRTAPDPQRSRPAENDGILGSPLIPCVQSGPSLESFCHVRSFRLWRSSTS